jgi:hypothetical protein
MTASRRCCSHARTADFQDVTVQATVTYRVIDPALAATRIDFGINPTSGLPNAAPLETLGGLLTELAQQPALDQLANMAMGEALARGIAPVRDRVAVALADDERLADRGLAVTDVRVGGDPGRGRPRARAADRNPGAGATGRRQGHLRTPGAGGGA